MPRFKTARGDELFYRDDDFTAPWEEPPTAVLLHAEAESSLAWFEWVPKLATKLRVVRPDLHGFGRSSAVREGETWSLDRLADDVVAVIEQAEAEGPVHLVGARLAGAIAVRMAATHPDLVASLTLCSAMPEPLPAMEERAQAWIRQIESEGMQAWANAAAAARLGEGAKEDAVAGWAGLLADTDRAALLSLLRNLRAFDVAADLERIQCPTLVITTDACPTQPLDATIAWQRRIPGSELRVLNGVSEHVAAGNAKEAAGAAGAFCRKDEKSKRDRGDKAQRKQEKERKREERGGGSRDRAAKPDRGAAGAGAKDKEERRAERRRERG